MNVRRVLPLAVVALLAANVLRAAAQQRALPPVVALLNRGLLDSAEHMARAAGPSSTVQLADILVLRGRLNAADSLYMLAVDRQLPDFRAAQAALAERAARAGDHALANRRAAQLIAAYTQSRAWPRTDLTAAGRAYAVLGATDPQAFHDALSAFDAAVAADSSDIDAQLRGADLLFAKYNAPDAEETYRTVLARAPGEPHALLGLAQVEAFRQSDSALPDLRASLRQDPVLVPALVFLAHVDLDREAYDSAAADAGRALAVDSSATGAWAVLGSLAWLRGDQAAFGSIKAAAARTTPVLTDFLADVAEATAHVRRYADAVALAGQAVAQDSLSAHALGILADNELRTGDMVAGREHLQRAFDLDPYNLWYKNTLDLLDQMKAFRTVHTARFEFVAPAADADYIALYLGPLMERAYDEFATRYDFRPPIPIRVELFNRHADFSVRTLGVTGLDAVLGVSFGNLLAFDAPSARDPGEFNYGSTAWHELAHTFTLGSSQHRVPRWFSEGLSVLEERRAQKGWGQNVTPEFLAAYKGGKLPHATDLNDGLMRPAYPAEINFSYYEASLVCEMIETEKGIAAIRGMLAAWGQGMDTPAVVEHVLGMNADAFNRHFDMWLRTRFATPLASVDSSDGTRPVTGRYEKTMTHALALRDAGNNDSARVVLDSATRLFPGYGGDDGAAWYLARLDSASGDWRGAVDQLAVITSTVETADKPNDLEAALRLQLGDSTGALAALQRLQWITPYDPALHVRTAQLAEAMGKWTLAVTERRAVLALAPADRLEARYQVARALQHAGDVAGARREVLAVLEAAPGFEKAQALLLELQGNH